MKAIKITLKNKAKVKAALKSKIKRRFSFEDVVEKLSKFEDHLKAKGVLKKHWKGVIVHCFYGDCVAKSYKYSATEQWFMVEYHSTGWFLIEVGTENVPSKAFAVGGRPTSYYIPTDAVIGVLSAANLYVDPLIPIGESRSIRSDDLLEIALTGAYSKMGSGWLKEKYKKLKWVWTNSPNADADFYPLAIQCIANILIHRDEYEEYYPPNHGRGC